MTELVVDAPALLLADRSSLERMADCPAMAQFVAGGRVITSSHPAEVGSAVHDVIGDLIREYVDSRGNIGITDWVDTGKQLLCASRPDVQQDAIAAARASLYAIGKYVTNIHPDNVLRHDGGTGDRCGQLAWDMEDMGVRVTSEVDLLHTGRAPELVTEIDWKTGRAKWDADDVEHSFQFQLHAWLILENYPDVECVSVRVWNTRLNALTYGVQFKRNDLPGKYGLDYKIRAAVQNWLRYRDKPAEECPT